jgi:hypothetical protein
VAAVRAAWPDKLLLATEATYEKYRWAAGTTLRAGDWAFGEGARRARVCLRAST